MKRNGGNNRISALQRRKNAMSRLQFQDLGNAARVCERERVRIMLLDVSLRSISISQNRTAVGQIDSQEHHHLLQL